METALSILSGTITPALLLLGGMWFGIRMRFFFIRHPVQYVRTLLQSASDAGTSPFAALSLALAGTLGVGNIAGVATAIVAGGAGAVLWMLMGAVLSMSVKYIEVFLAVRWRKIRTENGKASFYGGAMYYMRDGIGSRARTAHGRQAACVIGGIFAVLCAANALLTGNILQVRSAVSCTPLPPLLFGILFLIPAVTASYGGTQRVAGLTLYLIPTLSVLYIALSSFLILANLRDLPGIFLQIWEQAWDFRPAISGAAGFGISRAIRFGITRGIFSNEAGCGTSPTAHAAAHTPSAHHQGCLGIFEVFADTVLLCTLTALVILLYRDTAGLDGIELSLAAFTDLSGQIGGAWLAGLAGILLRLSIVLFAFATVVCQSCYGMEALRYFLPERMAKGIYLTLSAGAILLGSVISPGIMWQMADLVICLMTCLNVVCLWILGRKERWGSF